jgi:hypothetical protein
MISKSIYFPWDWKAKYKQEKIKDQPLFILASGPSLKDHDLSKLKNQHTMAFNRSFIAYDDWGFQPTYYSALDHVVNNDNKNEIVKLIENSKIKRFFFSKDEVSKKYFRSSKTTIIDISSDPKNVNLDFSQKLNVANTGLFGLQVALGVLNYKEIYLLGCDASYKENVPGVVKNDKGEYYSNRDLDVNHFRQDYFGKGTTYNVPKSKIFHLPAWKVFYDSYIKNNNELSVYNCSKTGKLQFFDFKDYQSLNLK